ncbi:MAG: hypothetical protein RI897_4027 [Verrucomicrobiota bacterium]
MGFEGLGYGDDPFEVGEDESIAGLVVSMVVAGEESFFFGWGGARPGFNFVEVELEAAVVGGGGCGGVGFGEFFDHANSLAALCGSERWVMDDACVRVFSVVVRGDYLTALVGVTRATHGGYWRGYW